MSDAGGFGPHPHKDIEIITYVRKGFVVHRDSLGHTGRIDAGDVQVMSARTGIVHDETCATGGGGTEIFQIWIRPRQAGGEPRWGTKPFPKTDRANRFVVLASGFEDDTDALMIRADARVVGASIAAGQSLSYPLAANRRAYLVPSAGTIRLNEAILNMRDGAAITDERDLRIEALADTEIVLVDVA